MGKKGAKLTIAATAAAERLETILANLGEISSRKMFGGYGLYESGAMFALVSSEGEIFLKADDTNRDEFETAGSGKFGRMPYYGLPSELLNDSHALRDWAATSMKIAHAAKAT